MLLMSACSRYEDGPWLSFKSPEKRLLGLWEITQLVVDGVDRISTYREDSVYVRFSIISYDNMYINIVKEGSSGSQYSSSLLSFEDNKKFMRFELKRLAAYEQYTGPIYNLVPPLEYDHQWKILQLKSKEFIIELEEDGVLYRLTFERLEKVNVS